jgi:hypothetical protein
MSWRDGFVDARFTPAEVTEWERLVTGGMEREAATAEMLRRREYAPEYCSALSEFLSVRYDSPSAVGTGISPDDYNALVDERDKALAENQQLRAFAEWVLTLEPNRTTTLSGTVIDRARAALAAVEDE